MPINISDKFVIKTLKECPNYYAETIKEIEKAFNYLPSNRFATDFYPLITKKNHENCYLLLDKKNQEIVGHIGVVIKKLVTQQATLDVAMMGGIFIKEKYQKQGLFSYLMEKIIAKYKDHVGFFMLWSNLVELYQKFDFFLAGGIWEASIPKGHHSSHVVQTQYHLLNHNEQQQLQRLYSHHTQQFTTFSRAKEDWNSIAQITSSELYLKYDKSTSEIFFYYFKNKGQDLQDIIHDFAFWPNHEKEFLESMPEGKFWGPEGYPLINHFKDSQLKYLALIKIGNEKRLLPFVSNLLQNKISITNSNKNIVNFTFNGEKYTTKISDLITDLWGPNRVSEWQELAPPLFISGLDSV